MFNDQLFVGNDCKASGGPLALRTKKLMKNAV